MVGSLASPYTIPVGTQRSIVTANNMTGFVSAAVVSNGAKVVFSGNLPGFVYLNGILQSHLGQSAIKKYLTQGTSVFYQLPMESPIENLKNFFGMTPREFIKNGVISF